MSPATDAKPVDFMSYFRILWRRKWMFLAVVIIIPVAVYVLSERSAKTYESSVLLQLAPTTVDTLENSSSTGPTAQYIAIAARLIQTTGVAQAAAKQLPPPRPTPGWLLQHTSVGTDPNTGFMTLTATAGRPSEAANIANAFASAINGTRASQAVQQLNIGITSLSAQLKATPPSARSLRTSLLGQIERLRAQRAAQGTNAQVIEPALANPSAISPHPARNTVLALLVAVLLGLGLVALLESLDQRLRSSEDVEEILGAPALASIPRTAFEGAETPRTIEAFRSLRTNLAFFNVDRDLSSIVIASARPEEGKTTVAINLARAYAFSGSDVVLVDADLRRARVAERLGLDVPRGLAEVLSGQVAATDALVEVPAPGSDSGRLWVLPAGEAPPNPAELLASQRMQRLLEELRTLAPVVIIDTSPLLAVSDALPLLDRVAGTLLVTRVLRTPRGELRRLRRLTEEAKCSTLGAVLTGVVRRRRRNYPYAPYGPAVATNGQPPQDGGRSRRILAGVGRRR